MSDIKQDVKAFVKIFILIFVSNVVKESTKRMIKNLSKGKKKLLESRIKKMSDDQIVQYLDKSSFFKNTLENSVKSIFDLSSSRETGSLIGKLESIYETTSTFNNPINTLILPASKTIVAVTVSTAAVATTVFIIIIMPTANFTSNVTEGPAPLCVQFTDLSENATEWYWDFGDGSSSSKRDPMHTYYEAGDYTVKLKASNENGTGSKRTKIKVIPTEVVPPIANFSSNVSEGYAPLSVQFADLSENATEWNWDFGDRNSSSEQNPVHTYSLEGNYTVLQAVNNANGTASKSATIIVSEPEGVLPVANFSTNASEGYAPLSVQFNDSSENATSLSWNFGDRANSSEQNPVHIYSMAGNYTVSLTAANENGTDSKSATINVTKSIPAISWSSLANITYGTALNSTQLNAKASVPGTFFYTPPSGTLLSAGTLTLHVDFTPDDTANYSNISSNATINVNKATPIVSWNNPADIIYGTPLSSTQLSASASVHGTFIYTPPAGTVLNAGTQTLYVDFTPADYINYSTTSKNVMVDVLKSTGPYAYITNAGSDNVSVINTTTNIVVATVNVGDTPVAVAVNQDGTKAYVTNYWSKTVSIIDTATNTVTANVPVGITPEAVAVNPAGTKVYVTHYMDDNVSVINTATNTVTATINVGQRPQGIAVNPEGTRVYVTNRYSNNVSVIDTATNTVIATVNVENGPKGVRVNPAGTKVYVANSDGKTVSVIDTATNTVSATINVGKSPCGVAVNPTGTKVYVTNYWDNNVSVIDTATNIITATTPVGNKPEGISITPDGTKVYVVNTGSSDVSVIDAANNIVAATVPVGSDPMTFGQFIGPLLTE